ncbi:MAG: hypothetical protein WC675_03445 [Patescibacteria group bacterium]|jgi:hypothetical protein
MIDFLFQRKNYLILIFTVAYLIAFTVNAIIWANFEFLYYTVLMVVIIYLVITLTKKLHLGFFILFNLSILGFLHLLGGNFYLGSVRLYDFYLISGIIRYDNFIHTYATFIATLTLYSLLFDFVDERIRQNYPIFALILVLMAIGLGAINELVELFAVVAFGVAEKVGGYFNNALDLLFNTIGAILATVVIHFYLERPKFIQRIDGQTKKDN